MSFTTSKKKSKKGIATPQPEIERIRETVEAGSSRSPKGISVMKPPTESSGNLFEDLELANSKQLPAKAELARHVYLIIKKRGLTQMAVAALLGQKQPDVSLLMRRRLSRFSTDRLIQMLNLLDRDVGIVSGNPVPSGRPD